MPRKILFMDGETLMAEIEADASSVVTRPATDEEEAEYLAIRKYERDNRRVQAAVDSADKPPLKRKKKK